MNKTKKKPSEKEQDEIYSTMEETMSVNIHSSDVTSCHFSITGILATASSDRTVRLWGQKGGTLKEIAVLSGHSYGVNCCRFSPQGTLLATCSTDCATIIWDVQTKLQLASFLQPSGSGVRVCEFCPDSALLATAGDDDQVCIWDLGEKELVRTISTHEATIFSLAFSPEGSTLATSDTEGHLKLWAALPHHHKPLASQESAHDLGVTALAFSPIYKSTALETRFVLASTGQDGMLVLWKLKTGAKQQLIEELSTFAHEGSAMAVCWSPDGKYIASAGGDKMVKLWNAVTLTCVRVLEGHQRFVTCCSFSPIGSCLVSGSNDRTIKLWNLRNNQEFPNTEETNVGSSRNENRFQLKLSKRKSKLSLSQKLGSHSSDVTCCDFLEYIFASGSADKSVRLWKRKEVEDDQMWEEEDFSPLLGHFYSVYAVQFSKRGHLVSASLDGSVIVWDHTTGRKLQTYNHPEATGFRTVSISPKGDIIAAGGDEDRCHVWVPQTESITILPSHPNTVYASAISSDGILLAVGCSAEVLRLWALSSIESSSPSLLASKEEVHDLGILCCAFHPLVSQDTNSNHYTLATGGNDGLVKIWVIKYSQVSVEMTVEAVLREHSGPVMSLSFSPCGLYLGSSSGDKTAKVWSSLTWRVTLTLPHHIRYVTACAFSADSQFFATCCEKYTNLWKLNLENNDQGEKKEDLEEDDIPEEFYCPITYDLMKVPVKCSDGFTYEESAIREWLMTRRNTSPMTNLEIKTINLIPDVELRKRIEEFQLAI